MVGVPPSSALLGGFAMGARVSLLWQHRANAKCQRVLVLALCLVRGCVANRLTICTFIANSQLLFLQPWVNQKCDMTRGSVVAEGPRDAFLSTAAQLYEKLHLERLELGEWRCRLRDKTRDQTYVLTVYFRLILRPMYSVVTRFIIRSIYSGKIGSWFFLQLLGLNVKMC